MVPNASPYERGKDDVRLDLCVRRAREAGAALAYANMIGGQDELVFDGDSILVAADGALLARGPQFEEALVVADLDLPAAPGRQAADQPVDAGDGTVITIKRVTLPPSVRRCRPVAAMEMEEAAEAAGVPEVERPEGAGLFWPRLSDPAEVYGALVTRGPGLRAQERFPLGDPGAVRRDRLGADRDDRRRRDRAGPSARGADAEPVLLGSFGHRCRGPGASGRDCTR